MAYCLLCTVYSENVCAICLFDYLGYKKPKSKLGYNNKNENWVVWMQFPRREPNLVLFSVSAHKNYKCFGSVKVKWYCLVKT